MPRFERGKGKFFYEIHQYGYALSVREWAQGENRLAGYCMFADAAEASRELERLLRKKSAEGFLPADDLAKALAASLKLEPPGPKVKPSLPIRQDIHVYNTATGFTIASFTLAGKSMEDNDRKWNKAIQDGLLIPVSLFQDDSFAIRVVAGDALTTQEQEEWVGRLEWRLDLAKGKLCISSGAEWLYEGLAATELADDESLRIVELPPGHYRATLYSYLGGVNGSACLDQLAGGYGQGEPVGQWFRRTRPEDPFPEWLVYRCVAHSDNDPGHEQEWANRPLPDAKATPELISFLLHLEPAEPSAITATAKPENGWFSVSEGARKPERCPLGLIAKDVIGREQRQQEGNWIWPREIFPLVAGFNAVPVAGGEVAVPLDQLDDVYRLATFCCFDLLPEIRIVPQPGRHFPIERKWPEGLVAIEAEGTVRLLMAPGGGRLRALQSLSAALDQLKMLPEETTLEMVTSALEHQAPPKKTRPIGTHRYYGTIRNGYWHMQSTFPEVNAETLRAALAVAAESRLCNGFKVRDDDEAKEILRCSEANNGSLLEDNPPLYEGGLIRLREPDPNYYNRVGGAVFTVRHANVWPLVDFSKE
jgi:hypothetical protein